MDNVVILNSWTGSSWWSVVFGRRYRCGVPAGRCQQVWQRQVIGDNCSDGVRKGLARSLRFATSQARRSGAKRAIVVKPGTPVAWKQVYIVHSGGRLRRVLLQERFKSLWCEIFRMPTITTY